VIFVSDNGLLPTVTELEELSEISDDLEVTMPAYRKQSKENPLQMVQWFNINTRQRKREHDNR
jgi:hypothetical protein